LALQPVGKSGDGTLQTAQLLVEEGPQPLQLVGGGEAFRGHLLVVGTVENLVAKRLRVIENVEVWPPGLPRLGHLLTVGVGFELVGVSVLSCLGVLTLLALTALLVARLVLTVLALGALLSVLIPTLGILLVILAFLPLAFRELVGEIKHFEQVAQLPAEGCLVFGKLIELCQRPARPLLNPRPPKVHHGPSTVGGTGPRQSLAHHERQRILERRVSPLCYLRIAAMP